MKYRRIIALISVFTLAASAYSCGKTEENATSEPPVTTNAANTTTTYNAGTGWKSGTWSNSSGKTNNNQQQNNGNNTQQQKQQLEESVIIPPTNNGSSRPNGNSSQNGGNTAPQQQYYNGNNNYIPSFNYNNNNSNNNNNPNNNNSGNNNNGGNNANNNPSNSNAGTVNPPSTTYLDDEDDIEVTTTEEGTTGESIIIDPGTVTYTADIVLGENITVDGTDVTVNGNVVSINAGGDYKISGTLADGQIYVNTVNEEKVTLALDGVNITNSAGPAILVEDAKRCTIKPLENTVNYLTDGGKDKVYDGAIFSNDTLRFKGKGELNITANNAHGISCDDDIIFDNGRYNISSVKTGVFANDDITINEGMLEIKGGTNGIKSKGTLNVNGGTTIVSGGNKEDKSAVYSEGYFNYIGGHLYAAGNRVSLPNYMENSFILLDLGRIEAAGSKVEMGINGQKMVEFSPHNDFRCLLMLAPELVSDSIFKAVVDGCSTGDFQVLEGPNLFRMN